MSLPTVTCTSVLTITDTGYVFYVLIPACLGSLLMDVYVHYVCGYSNNVHVLYLLILCVHYLYTCIAYVFIICICP